MDDYYALEEKKLKQLKLALKKKIEEGTRRWVAVHKGAELARQGDVSIKTATGLVDESIARIAELSEATGKPPPPTKLQVAVAAAQQLQLQLSGLPAQETEAIGGVADLLASLQATVAAAAGDAAMGDATQSADVPAPSQMSQTVEAHGVADPPGNAAPEVAVTEDGAPSNTTPTEPAKVADPSGDAAPGTPATSESVPAIDGDQQTSAISATSADTELVAQANVLSQAVQYDAPQLAEARIALGARLAYPPVDFDAVRCGVQQVQEAMAKQAEADDVPPRAKNRRPAGEGGEDGDADDL